MLPHPKTIQMVADQRWHELQVRVARERLGLITPHATGDQSILHNPTRGRVAAALGTAWSMALASVRLAPLVIHARRVRAGQTRVAGPGSPHGKLV
jgi:hypothetical protein